MLAASRNSLLLLPLRAMVHGERCARGLQKYALRPRGASLASVSDVALRQPRQDEEVQQRR